LSCHDAPRFFVSRHATTSGGLRVERQHSTTGAGTQFLRNPHDCLFREFAALALEIAHLVPARLSHRKTAPGRRLPRFARIT